MNSMEEIYRQHSSMVYRYLLTLTKSAQLSEELTQETFYQAVKSIDSFDESCKITTWLCSIAKNSLMAYRRKHPICEDITNSEAESASAEAVVLSQQGRVEIMKKLHLLTGEVREVMYLRLLGNLSFRQIGEILSQTENWARVNYYRGRERLKKEINENE